MSIAGPLLPIPVRANDAQEKVLCMGTLEKFDDDLWIVAGPVVTSLKFQYPTRMAVIRLSDTTLFVWSPVALSSELRRELDAIGVVRFLIAPNTLHHIFLPEWRTAYPEAMLYGAPGLPERRRDIVFYAELGDEPPEGWAGQVDQTLMRGNRITTEVVFFHRKTGIALFTDLIQHFPKGWFTGWRAVVARLDGMTGPEPRVPQKFRLAFADRKAARASLNRVLSWPIEKVIMAHAAPVSEDGRAFVARAFHWLGQA